MLEDTENWLYEEGEDQPKQIYVDKLQELKVNFSKSMLMLNRTLSFAKDWFKSTLYFFHKYVRNF